HFFNEEIVGKRFVPAGPDHAQVAALAGIVDYLEALDAHHFDVGDELPPEDRMARLTGLWRAHETELLAPLLEHLDGRDDLRVLGPTDAEARMPTVSIAGPRPGAVLAAELAEHGVMAGGGHFYAYRLIEAMGVDPEDGVLRVSFVHNTSREEIERLIGALEALD
ncbi:MAG: aminotransferase class V-fold PLP-dependent enzyme, partial [Nitriliruptorales bacterium]|nr:aminotransferase class V-fold PLP-dependent enzyme [Nitriliruptorales bacterium]